MELGSPEMTEDGLSIIADGNYRIRLAI